jgi:Fe-S-cluster containining protein
MDKYIENKHWPCIEKKCWRCCNPVKISFRKGYDSSEISVPKDTDGHPLWISEKEIRAPENNVDTTRIQIYTCLLYDKNNKTCKDYEHRPNICRNTSCIDSDAKDTIDAQHKKNTNVHFIKIKK